MFFFFGLSKGIIGFVRISFLPSYEQIDSVVHIGIPDCFRGDSGERERSIIPHLLARMIELEVLRILCEAIDINDRDRGRRQIDRFLLEFRDEREVE